MKLSSFKYKLSKNYFMIISKIQSILEQQKFGEYATKRHTQKEILNDVPWEEKIISRW